MDPGLIANLVIFMVVLLLAISAHECAHAWMSDRFGDDTARLLGRVTLNPIAHIDPLGTLLLPAAGFIFGYIGGPLAAIPFIGWGKPTPVNPLRWRNKDLANVMVSIAGILANLIIAIGSLIILKIILRLPVFGADGALGSVEEPLFLFLMRAIFTNISLAVFNLLPFPPLDGSKALWSLAPPLRPALETLERLGPLQIILLILVVRSGVLDIVFDPIYRFVIFLIRL